MPSIKNSIIFISIIVVLVLAYIFFIKSDSGVDSQTNLISSAVLPGGPISTIPNQIPDKDFLPLLLSVRNIKLDDSIFTNQAFLSLIDSSIVLTPEGTEGRPNPFAPLGSDAVSAGSSGTPNKTGGSAPKTGSAN